jgi:hypothetical protein
MGATSIDLFRSGNASSARLDRVRTGPNGDVDTFVDAMGDVWVRSNGRGMSSADSPEPSWRGAIWKLPQGHIYSELLIVWEDLPGHWVWQPVRDMLLSNYEDALAQSNARFEKL